MENFKVTQYELKTNNRFLVEFPSRFNVQQLTVQKINKPKFTDGKWENIKIEFIDPIVPSTSQSLFKIVEFLKTDVNNSKTLFVFRIKALDAIGVEIEEWVVDVEKVLTINFGEFDYSDDKIQQPHIILKPLNCVLK
jgi:hypothetical protein